MNAKSTGLLTGEGAGATGGACVKSIIQEHSEYGKFQPDLRTLPLLCE